MKLLSELQTLAKCFTIFRCSRYRNLRRKVLSNHKTKTDCENRNKNICNVFLFPLATGRLGSRQNFVNKTNPTHKTKTIFITSLYFLQVVLVWSTVYFITIFLLVYPKHPSDSYPLLVSIWFRWVMNLWSNYHTFVRT